MKKVLLMTFLMSMAFISNAQSKQPLVKSSMSDYVLKIEESIQSNVTTTSVRVGKTFNKSTLCLVASGTNTNTIAYSAGVDYSTLLYTAKALSFKASGTVTMDLNKAHALTFSPGLAAGVRLCPYATLEATLYTPIGENVTLFKPTLLRSGIQLVLNL